MESSFYFWKTVYHLDTVEKDRMRSMNVKRLFVRIMDVDTQGPQGEAIPISSITFREPVPETVSIVPVIYIVNQVLKGITNKKLDELSANVYRFVQGKVKQSGKAGFNELQIDCDWTSTTREAYFIFLKALRNRMEDTIRLSATLRLHQVRNRLGSGIPPVDRVLLMCYNMGNLRQYGEHNSILDLHEMDTYLTDFLANYPLPVDVALPLFSWPVIFRNGQYAGISKQLDMKLLGDSTIFTNTPGSLLYRLKKPLPKTGLRVGDEVRHEESKRKDLLAAVHYLSAHKRQENFTLLFYHLDSQVLQSFSDEQLQEIIHCF